jgi:uncharacterized phage protein gp47/JayE
MTLEFTATGLTIQTYDEIFEELAAAYRTIYGADINLDPDSPDGQRVGIEAKARLDIQSFALALYNQFDPDFAIGGMLNKIIKLAGPSRRPATRSQVDVTITTDRVLTLPVGYAVEDDLRQLWVTTEELIMTAGANAVTLVAENFGAVEADAATVTTPSTIVIGVISVTNAAAATVGVDEETDAELRTRRALSLQAPATSTTGGLFSALGSVAGVTDLVIYENDQDTTDVLRNIAPHTLWIVIEGGTVADIVETIAKNKTGGTGLKGTVSGDYVETLYKPDGTVYYITHTMEFDRPVDVPLYVSLTVEGEVGSTLDLPAIKAAIAAHDFEIGTGVSAGQLYADAYSIPSSTYTVTLLEISDDDVTYTDGALSPGYDGIFSIDVANITITDITPP